MFKIYIFHSALLMQNYFMFLCFKLFVVFSLSVTAYHTVHTQTQKEIVEKTVKLA